MNISVQNHCSQDFDPSESWHWLGIPHPANGAKKARKKCFFLNGVLMRPFATPLSANMMPSFRESSRGHQKFQYPPKKLKHRKMLRNGDNTKYKNPYNRLPTGSF